MYNLHSIIELSIYKKTRSQKANLRGLRLERVIKCHSNSPRLRCLVITCQLTGALTLAFSTLCGVIDNNQYTATHRTPSTQTLETLWGVAALSPSWYNTHTNVCSIELPKRCPLSCHHAERRPGVWHMHDAEVSGSWGGGGKNSWTDEPWRCRCVHKFPWIQVRACMTQTHDNIIYILQP